MQLTGENIYVRPVKEEDVDALLKLELKNKDLFQLFTELRDESFYTDQGQLDRINNAVKSMKKDQSYLFLIYLKGSNEVIGEVMLFEVARQNLQSCWIGYSIDKDHNGKGYMTEAVKLVVNYAFKELDLHRIEAGVMPHNTGSIKVLLKAGFHKEGLAKKSVKINGHWEDHVMLAIVNEETQDEVNKKVKRHNPRSIAPPMGPYTHLTTVPKGADLLVFSGQVGMDVHGNLPSEMNEQIRNTLQNIKCVLEEESVSADHIIKINIWATEEVDWDYFDNVWEEFHGGTPPAMTMSYVPALAVSTLKIEIEAWAAKW
ncbi:GNAT family N-acetyltransferase [Hazenella coriacea]|uniref:Ribosomal-protein-alanine N-acetyltransferase n=1 Tax=Hazenella coriacea TaxID=1179467 RepID=A0A4R3LEG6_9BACL|nr:GNAT family N-acetyltransferase [Hazenella coriacea]TCS96734.1 ribosomal-protein-alanine N-acetyltransferase [Hazenella coriacea]